MDGYELTVLIIFTSFLVAMLVLYYHFSKKRLEIMKRKDNGDTRSEK